jgi:hypothetical protein
MPAFASLLEGLDPGRMLPALVIMLRVAFPLGALALILATALAGCLVWLRIEVRGLL